MHELGLALKDAKILVASEGHKQLFYFDRTLSALAEMLQGANRASAKYSNSPNLLKENNAKLVANW